MALGGVNGDVAHERQQNRVEPKKKQGFEYEYGHAALAAQVTRCLDWRKSMPVKGVVISW